MASRHVSLKVVARLRRSGRLERVANFDGRALLERRQARGFSQDKLAGLVGIARQNLIAYEKGRRTPGAERLVQLAHALGLHDPLELTTATRATATLTDLRMRSGIDIVEVERALEGKRRRAELQAIEDGEEELDPELAKVLGSLLGVSEEELHKAHRRARGEAGSLSPTAGFPVPVVATRHPGARNGGVPPTLRGNP